MYTVCYVLTDSESMRIYSEFIVSVESLMLNGKPDSVALFTDQYTVEAIGDVLLKEMNARNVRMITVDVPACFSQKERSRYIKTNLRKHITGDILFVDTDTVIVRKLPKVISSNDIAMVTEFHLPRKDLTPAGFLQWDLEQYEKCNLQVDLSSHYYNSGVMWIKDNSKTLEFFAKWHEWWLITKERGVTNDQMSLNYVNSYVYPLISPLSDFYNVQLVQARGQSLPVRFLGEAVIFHYFHHLESPYILSKPEQRAKGVDNQEIQRLLRNPYEAFIPGKLVPYDEKIEEMYKSSSFLWLKSLYLNHPNRFLLLEKTLRKGRELKNRYGFIFRKHSKGK